MDQKISNPPVHKEIDPRTAPLADVLRYVAERLEPSRHGFLWKRCPEQLGEVTHEVACRSGCRGTSRVTAPANIGNLIAAAEKQVYGIGILRVDDGWFASVYDHSDSNIYDTPDEAVVRALAMTLMEAAK